MAHSPFVFLLLKPAPRHTEAAVPGSTVLYDHTRAFFATLAGLLADNPELTISLELVLKDGVISYIIATPAEWAETVQHHLYAAHPFVAISLLPNWTLFDGGGETAGATVSFTPGEGSLQTTPFAANDAISALLEVLAAAPPACRMAIQLILQTTKEKKSLLTDLAAEVGQGLKDAILGRGPAAQDEKEPTDKEKNAPFRATIQIMALAPTRHQANELVRKAAVTYHQLGIPGESRLTTDVPKTITPWLKAALKRRLQPNQQFRLTIAEAPNLYHLPLSPRLVPNLAALPSVQLPPPRIPMRDGLFLGYSSYRGVLQPIYLDTASRLRHLYAIGQTGTGKSTLFQSAMLQDMAAGLGCCFIDPHGEAIDWLLARVPRHRLNDVILFDPADSQAILGLNLLEWKTSEERDLLVQELIFLFYKLFDPNKTGMIGPQFEHWLRNAALTITEPKVRGTLVDIPRLFTDPEFLQQVLRLAEHPAVLDFWQKQMAATSGFHKSEMLNYFTSKFGSFLGNQTMYHILSQRHSAFDIASLMHQRKILLVNLSKGKLGSLNAELLGSLLVTKLQMAALSRAKLPPVERHPFYVYIDEFQNIATDSFSAMLSEIRKYNVGLHLTHQYVDQLPQAVKQAVAGNVGTMIAFRLGRSDADWLAPHFTPLTEDDLTNILPYHYHIRTLVDGTLTPPFTIRSAMVTSTAQPAVEQAIRQRMRLFAQAYTAAIQAQAM